MSSKAGRLTRAVRVLAIGTALVLISSGGAQATDAIDDPVRQPHLKSWSNIIPNAPKRFIVLGDFNDEAVLDRETGLVWEKAPITNPEMQDWRAACEICLDKNVGGRKGWRLPAMPELASLIDLSAISTTGLALPLGHPFIINQDQSAPHWSATASANFTYAAWIMFLFQGDPGLRDKSHANGRVWCVRGGMSADAY